MVTQPLPTSGVPESATLSVWRCVVIFAVSAVVRVAVSVILNQPAPAGGDAYGYHLMARNLVQHGILSEDAEPPFEPSGVRELGYPLFVAAVYKVAGVGPLRAVTAQSIVGAFGTVLLCCIVTYLARSASLALIGLTCVCHWTLPFLSAGWHELLREDLSNTILFALIWSSICGFQRQRLSSWLWAGLWIGLGAAVRGTFLVSVPAIAAAFVLTRQPMRNTIRATLATAVVCALPVAACVVRNYVLFGRMSLATVVGLMLYSHSGNPERVDGSEPHYRRMAHEIAAQWPNVPDNFAETRDSISTRTGWNTFLFVFLRRIVNSEHGSRVAADDVMKRLAVDDIESDWPRYWRRSTMSLAFYLTGGLVGGRPNPETTLAGRSRLFRIFHEAVRPIARIVLEVLALVGVVFLRRSPITWVIGLLAAVSLASPCLLVLPAMRYRSLFDALMAMPALIVVYHGLCRFGVLRSPQVVAPC